MPATPITPKQGVCIDDLVTSVAQKKVLARVPGSKHPAAEEIEKYFAEVYDLTVDLTSVQFPERLGMPCYMAVPTEMDEDQTLSRLSAYFNVGSYAWKTPVSKSVDRSTEQKRPVGLYVFAHVSGDEPDTKHLGKSHDDAVKEGLTFLSAREYLLVTGFHRWKHQKWMDDEKGWTMVSSLWSVGYLMYGYWFPVNAELSLGHDYCDYRPPESGVRELFLG